MSQKPFRPALVSLIALLALLPSQYCIADILEDTTKETNINGYMPSQIYISTLTQAFCKGYSFSIHNGRIWVKTDGSAEWSLFLDTGLPHRKESRRLAGSEWFQEPKAIRQIAADGDCIYAYDSEGIIYRCYLDSTTADPPFTWFNNFGFPEKKVFRLNDTVKNKRSWGMGVRRKDVLWYEDAFGNQHHFGTMGLETLYYLTESGCEIRFTDSGLPADFSRTIMGPERGAFAGCNMSVSADTLFLISESGKMYTRLIDFDTMGGDPMFFTYTYKKEEQKYDGKNYLSNYSPWGLPNEDWKRQPDIPLSGKARLTKYLCIFQNGQGNAARTLRVAGLSPNGETGFYHKEIKEESWSFSAAPLILTEKDFLSGSKAAKETLQRKSLIMSYSGFVSKNGVKLQGIDCAIPDFTLTSEGNCTLSMSYGGATRTFLLYTLEMWNHSVRYKPGFDGTAMNFFITPSFANESLQSNSTQFSEVLDAFFEGKNLSLYALSAAADNRYIKISAEKNNSIYTMVLARNGETLFDHAPHFFFQHGYDDYMQENLMLDDGQTYYSFDIPQIQLKIKDNEDYAANLQSEIRSHQKSSKDDNMSCLGFNALDVITTVTLLNKINFPKIKNFTAHTGDILSINAKTSKAMFEYRSLVYPHLIKLLEARIDCYKDLISGIRQTGSGRVSADLCNTYPDYFKVLRIAKKYSGRSKSAGENAFLSINDALPIYPAFILTLESEEAQSVSIQVQDVISKARNAALQEQSLQVAFTPLECKKKSNVVCGIKNIDKRAGFMTWSKERVQIYVKDGKKNKLLFEGYAQ